MMEAIRVSEILQSLVVAGILLDVGLQGTAYVLLQTKSSLVGIGAFSRAIKIFVTQLRREVEMEFRHSTKDIDSQTHGQRRLDDFDMIVVVVVEIVATLGDNLILVERQKERIDLQIVPKYRHGHIKAIEVDFSVILAPTFKLQKFGDTVDILVVEDGKILTR